MHASKSLRRQRMEFLHSAAVSMILACAMPRASAQNTSTPAGPASPSTFHERLTFFEGTWTVAGTPMEQNLRETCAWLPEGRRHMVCRVRWVGPSGAREGWSIFSYSTKDSTYTYHGFRAGGSVVVQQGREEGGVWRFFGEHGTGAALTRTRVTITPQPDSAFIFLEETAIANGPWKAGEGVRYVRVSR